MNCSLRRLIATTTLVCLASSSDAAHAGDRFVTGFELWETPRAFTDIGLPVVIDIGQDIAVADLDGDGLLDIFVANDGINTLWIQSAPGQFAKSEMSHGSADSRAVVLADVNTDGYIDVIVANWDASSVVYCNDGHGVFNVAFELPGTSNSRAVAVGNLDRDGDTDLFLVNEETPDQIWYGNGDCTFSDPQALDDDEFVDLDGVDVAIADFDGDDYDDILVVHEDKKVVMWRNEAPRKFDGRDAGDAEGATSLAVAHLDDDDRWDVFITTEGGSLAWSGDGDGGFTNIREVETGPAAAVALGDVNGDGRVDAVVTTETTTQVWWSDNDGDFERATYRSWNGTEHVTRLIGFGAGGSLAVALGDADGDADLDAFVANSDVHSHMWRNVQGPIAKNNTYIVLSGSTKPVCGTRALSANPLKFCLRPKGVFKNDKLEPGVEPWGIKVEPFSFNGGNIRFSLPEPLRPAAIAGFGFDPEDGGFFYKSAGGFTGLDWFHYTVTTTLGGEEFESATARVHLVVLDPSDFVPPAARDDEYTMAEDTPLDVSAEDGVLSNDSFLESLVEDSVAEHLGSVPPWVAPLLEGVLPDMKLDLEAAPDANRPPAHGTVRLSLDGSFTYRPDSNFRGDDSFGYLASADGSEPVSAEVVIHVEPRNSEPVAVADSYILAYSAGETLTIADDRGVLLNDTDQDGDALTAGLGTMPVSGSLQLFVNGGFTYTRDADFEGEDVFTYSARDNAGTETEAASSPVDVRMTVREFNSPPVPEAAPRTITEDSTLYGTVKTKGTDPDGDRVRVRRVAGPAHGKLQLAPTGAYNYVPDPDFEGVDAFEYYLTDGTLDSAVETVTITVQGKLEMVRRSPNRNVVSAPVDTAIEVEFDGEIDPASLAQGLFVYGGQSGRRLATGDDLEINGTTLTLTPTQPFGVGERVTVIVTTALQDLDGQTLSQPVQWQFRVAASAGEGRFVPGPIFGPTSTYVTPLSPGRVADLDGDGDLDLFGAHLNATITPDYEHQWHNPVQDTDTPFIWLNRGDGTFEPTAELLDHVVIQSAVGDFDGDGDVDGVILDVWYPEEPTPSPYFRLETWINNEGSFARVEQPGWESDFTQCYFLYYESPLSVADLDGDGDLDLQVGAGVALNDGGGNFTCVRDVLPSTHRRRPSPATLGDADGDGDMDIALGGDFLGPVALLVNGGDASFTIQELTPQKVCHNVVLAQLDDLDRDGDLDLVTTDGVWTGRGDGGFEVAEAPGSVECPLRQYLGSADFDGDGDIDIAAEPMWLNSREGQGPLGFVAGPSLPTLLDPVSDRGESQTGDFDGDGSIDVLLLSLSAPLAMKHQILFNRRHTPLARGDVYTTAEDAPLVVGAAAGVLSNDDLGAGQPGSEAAHLIADRGPYFGDLVFSADGSFTYTPDGDAHGQDGFFYYLTAGDGDGQPLASVEEAYVALLVDPVNDPPRTSDEDFEVFEGGVLEVAAPGVLANDWDIEPAGITCRLDTPPVGGMVSLGTDGAFIYTPNPGFSGLDRFIYAVSDGQQESFAIADITVTPELRIVWSYPAAGANVPDATEVQLAFDRDLRTATVPDAVTFVGSQSGGLNSTLVVNGPQLTATFAPPPLPGETVRVTIGDAIRGFEGARLAETFGWTFVVSVAASEATFWDSGQRIGANDPRDAVAGDLDGDGHLDVFIANGLGGNQVFYGDGAGDLRDGAQRLGDAGARAAATGDLDGDGLDDVLVVGDSGGRVWLHQDANQTRVLTAPLPVFGVGAYSDVALALIDGDSALDAVIIGPNGASIWLNDGVGGLTATGTPLGAGQTRAVATGDLNGDGAPDMVVGYSDGPNRVWLGDGLGGFTAGVAFGSGGTTDLGLGDLDGDEALDIFVTKAGGTPDRVYLGDGAGGFVDTSQTIGDANSGRVVLADVDADGALDAAVAGGRLWRNTGDGTFTPFAFDYLGDAVALAFGEFNEEAPSYLDALVVYASRPTELRYGAVNGLVGSGKPLSAYNPKAVALGDLDRDGDLDAFVANADGHDQVLLGDGDGGFVDSGRRLGSTNSRAAAISDLNGDGFLDVVVVSRQYSGSRVWFGDSSGELVFGSFLPVGPEFDALALGDVDGDGSVDVVGAKNGANAIFLNDGKGAFTLRDEVGTSETLSVGLGDVDGDGDLDLYAGNDGADRLWLNDGTGGFTNSGQVLSATESPSVSLSDFNGDGFADVFVLGLREVSLYRGAADAVLTPGTAATGLPSSALYSGAALGDLDGDGDLDALLTSRIGRNDVLIQVASGVWARSPQDLRSGYSRGVALGDLDRDGDLDAFIVAVSDNSVGFDNQPAHTVWLNTAIPAANDDAYVVTKGQVLTVVAPGVLGNDSAPPGPREVVLVEAPTEGSLTLQADGAFEYTAPDPARFDSFTYYIQAGDIASAPAQVKIVPYAPPIPQSVVTATPDGYEVERDAELVVDAPGVLGNDDESTGATLTATLVFGPTHGEFTFAEDGAFTFTPEPGFVGTDVFAYTASNGVQRSGTTPVLIEVKPPPPVVVTPSVVTASEDVFETPEDETLVVGAPGVLANDTDSDGAALTATLLFGPQNGALTLAADGGFTFTPDPGFSGNDVFTYTASNGTETSEATPVVITVASTRVTTPGPDPDGDGGDGGCQSGGDGPSGLWVLAFALWFAWRRRQRRERARKTMPSGAGLSRRWATYGVFALAVGAAALASGCGDSDSDSRADTALADDTSPEDTGGAHDTSSDDTSSIDTGGTDDDSSSPPDSDAPTDSDAPSDTQDSADVYALCGNGAVEGDEACDDGNRSAGDGCSPTCALEDPCLTDPGPSLISGLTHDAALLVPGDYALAFDAVVDLAVSDLTLARASGFGTPGAVTLSGSGQSYVVSFDSALWVPGDVYVLAVGPGATNATCGVGPASPLVVTVHVLTDAACAEDVGPVVTSAVAHPAFIDGPVPYVLTFDVPVTLTTEDVQFTRQDGFDPSIASAPVGSVVTSQLSDTEFLVTFGDSSGWADGEVYDLTIDGATTVACRTPQATPFVAAIEATAVDPCAEDPGPVVLSPDYHVGWGASPAPYVLRFDQPVVLREGDVTLTRSSGTGWADAPTVTALVTPSGDDTFQIDFDPTQWVDGDVYTLRIDWVSNRSCGAPMASPFEVTMPVSVANPCGVGNGPVATGPASVISPIFNPGSITVSFDEPVTLTEANVSATRTSGVGTFGDVTVSGGPWTYTLNLDSSGWGDFDRYTLTIDGARNLTCDDPQTQPLLIGLLAAPAPPQPTLCGSADYLEAESFTFAPSAPPAAGEPGDTNGAFKPTPTAPMDTSNAEAPDASLHDENNTLRIGGVLELFDGGPAVFAEPYAGDAFAFALAPLSSINDLGIDIRIQIDSTGINPLALGGWVEAHLVNTTGHAVATTQLPLTPEGVSEAVLKFWSGEAPGDGAYTVALTYVGMFTASGPGQHIDYCLTATVRPHPPFIADTDLEPRLWAATTEQTFNVTFSQPVDNVNLSTVGIDNGAALSIDSGADGATDFVFTASNLAAGESYRVTFNGGIVSSVGGWSMDAATVETELAAPPGNGGTCATAVDVTGKSEHVESPFNHWGTDGWIDDHSAICGYQGLAPGSHNPYYFSYTPANDGYLHIYVSTTSPGNKHMVGATVSCDVDTWVPRTCQGGANPSWSIFDATAGQTYYFVLFSASPAEALIDPVLDITN